MSEKRKDEKDGFDTFHETCIECIDEVAKFIPQYQQSVTNMQEACIDSCRKMTDSSITIAKEIAETTWGPGRFPSAVIKNAKDASENIIKVAEVNNKALIATLDAAGENVRLFNNNLETFTKLNLNMIKTWQSLLVPPRP